MDILTSIFLSIIDRSITATYIIAGIILIRFLLKKAPRIFSYTLWFALLVRLASPSSFELNFRFLKLFWFPMQSANENSRYILNTLIDTAPPAVIPSMNEQTPILEPVAATPIHAAQVLLSVFTVTWIVGIVGILIYSIWSYLHITKKVSGATLLRQNIYESENVETPFVCGFVHPKIYLPLNLNDLEQDYVITHEQIHIRRKDYLIKPIAFIVLTIYWLNPAIWIAFILMSRDMETSCDEAVMQKLGENIKVDYCGSLLSFATKRAFPIGSPLSFGESNAGIRIKSILRYKKPSHFIILLAFVITVLLGACIFTNPASKAILTENDNIAKNYVQDFANSVAFDNETGTLSFTIPKELSSQYSFGSHVSGRIKMDGGGMSFHLFEEESDNNSWEPGKTYSHEFGKGAMLETLIYVIAEEYGNPEMLCEARIDIDEDGNITQTDLPKRTKVDVLTFPSNNDVKNEFNASINEVEPFGVSLELPDGWRFGMTNSSGEYDLLSVFSKYYIFNENDECVGVVGYNTYELYEGAEDDPRAIYNQIALGNDYQFNVRDSFAVMNKMDYGTTATVDVNYSAVVNNGIEKTNKGIVSNNIDFLVYIAAEFANDKITEEQLENIAKSVQIMR